MELLAARRWKAHISDINAAGSFFAMGMFIALGVALRRDRRQFAWIAVGVPPRVGDVGDAIPEQPLPRCCSFLPVSPRRRCFGGSSV